MLRMIRLHGNAVEYIPLALVLMAIYEITGGSHTLLHVAGIVLIVGRILQTWNMWSTPMAGFGRITGQSSTWLTIVALAGSEFLEADLTPQRVGTGFSPR